MPNRLTVKLAVAMAAGLLSAQAGLADPLHKSGTAGDYVHEGSGWIFPRTIGGLERVGAPYTIDGNNDVGAEYAMVTDGRGGKAWVDVYYADSAASGAKLETAAAAMKGSAKTTELKGEERFGIRPHAGFEGTKLTFAGSGNSQSALYFFQTSQWVVTVRTHVQSNDTDATKALDEFVRTLRWDTLGTDPGNLHGGA